MKILLAFTLGALALFLWSWLEDMWLSVTGTPHRCDAGKCRHGVEPDNCLMCAIEAPDEETPLVAQIRDRPLPIHR
jgi:hypothetical protein